MFETRYVQDFGSENIASVQPWSRLIIHLDPREHANITQHILTFNQTAIRCVGQYKKVRKVKKTVGVIDLSAKGGGGRTERGQVSSMWKEDQSLGCGTRQPPNILNYLSWHKEIYMSLHHNHISLSNKKAVNLRLQSDNSDQ